MLTNQALEKEATMYIDRQFASQALQKQAQQLDAPAQRCDETSFWQGNHQAVVLKFRKLFAT